MAQEAFSLRTYLRQLEQLPASEFVKIDKEVSVVYEACALLAALEKQGRYPAVLFEHVKGFGVPVLSNLFASRTRLALALGVEPDQLYATLRAREDLRIQPELVDAASAPVKEVRLLGDQVDCRRLPVLVHHAADAGPYITAGAMVVRDPDTGIRNIGAYRHHLIGKDKIGIGLSESSHAYGIDQKYTDRRQPMEVAIAVGHHPAFYLGILGYVPLDADEYQIAGGLMQQPLPLVKCETVDLEVPAQAEIVFEGTVMPDDHEPEGPFGETAGIYGTHASSPMMHVTAITMRRDPIWLDVFAGHADHQIMGITPRMASVYRMVRVACPTVREIYMPTSGCCRFICYISVKKRFEGEAKNTACAAFAADPFLKYVVVVDEDVDIFNDSAVMNAIALRAGQDSFFVIHRAKGHSTDPMAIDGYLTTKTGIDATRPLRGYPKEISVPGAGDVHLADYLPGLG